MKKENVLQDFVDYSVPQNESDALKGGRANNPINTGSFGFIDWGDVGVRDSNLFWGTSFSSIQFSDKFKKH